jgi:hypothetical protein
LFSLSENDGLFGAINDYDLQQANRLLQSDMVEHFEMIREITDG